MTYTKKDVVCKLREYPALMRIKQQIEFELSLLSAADSEQMSKLSEALLPVSTELRRMEFYIELLPEEDGAIIKSLYFGGLTHRDAATKLVIDTKTVTNRKNRGLAELAVMYSRLPD
jgi:DNA-directed RNA polymerase specialized sigma24 family protein